MRKITILTITFSLTACQLIPKTVVLEDTNIASEVKTITKIEEEIAELIPITQIEEKTIERKENIVRCLT